ncbi:hypothetical protein [Myxosarcina sp. GI1]|uniref:hypothetical protein n=1 Tax=Myxosarcina sp. GI1 TaxID=1541065 RepID=UPI00056CDAAD|nr:hypothetical protein [Myxosarcina sp. GI1]
MLWSKKIPWLSSILLLLTYGVFGWSYTSWGTSVIESGSLFQALEKDLATIFLYSVGGVLIILLAIAFTAPISLMTISLSTWLRSETRAFLSIFIGAFAFALIVQKITLFANFLLLLSAALLVKLDLQLAGYTRWLSWLLLTTLCLLGFAGGILAFNILR